MSTTVADDLLVRGRSSARVFGIFVAGLFAVLAIRLLDVQVLAPKARVEKARAQSRRGDHLAGASLAEKTTRGAILDRAGRILAESWWDHDLVIDPAEALLGLSGTALYEGAVRLADTLGAALSAIGRPIPDEELRREVLAAIRGGKDDGPRRWMQVARGLSPRDRRVMEGLLAEAKVRGFSFEERLRRGYPYGAIVSQLLGVVGESEDDGSGRIAGRAGVEELCDRLLDGSRGVLVAERDAKGRELLPSWCLARDVVPGADVVLTIDAEIQRICMDVLAETAKASEAASASAVVLAVKSGEILAAATWPSVAPEDLATHPDRLKLGAFVDLYEPGSTIKPVFVSWALQQKVITAGTFFDCGGPKGYEVFEGREVREYTANASPLTTEMAIVKSSNVAAVRIGYQRLGLSRMYDALEAFDLAWKPRIAFPVPSGCRYTPRAKARGIWTGASFPQGYEIMTSPLGLARIYLTLARRGELVDPVLLREVRGRDRIFSSEDAAPGTRQVIDRDIADTVLGFLERVVEEGTGKEARSAKWAIGGKTGTPKITGTNLYNPVFCGIAPIRDPEIVVVLQQHRVRGRGHGTYSGGAVSAPFAKRIIERTLEYLAVPPEAGRPEKAMASK